VPLRDGTIAKIGADHDKTPAQVILRWHMQYGHIAIPKSAKPERMAENLAIFDFELSAEEIATIDALDKGLRVGPDPDTYEGV
jgi:diketogulonate reductase-like aldo/keto reductase